MTQYRVTRTIAPDIKLVFLWEGGAYIDVQQEGDPYANEVINIFDYEKGEPRVPFTKPAMRLQVDNWIKDYPRADLVHDVRENWTR